MLKKIKSKQIILGMHLESFCGSWIDHPFWRSAFVITDQADIDAILACKVKEVWIDTGKGLDVVQETMLVSESEPTLEPPAGLNASGERAIARNNVSITNEFARAAVICAQAKGAVRSMFEEARLGKAVDTRCAKELVEEISGSVSRSPGALISLARLKTADDYTYMHSVAVCALMIALSKTLNLNETETRSAGIGGLLHDLGKALMPIEVLNKPGKLSNEEFAIIRAHSEAGHELLLSSSDADKVVLDVVLHHHEKSDGSGYPKQLTHQEISLYAKMGTVCDVYDAITSNRPYKAGWDPSVSLCKMAEWCGGHLDAGVFQAFVRSLGIYPVGSLVSLSSGRIGVVVGQARDSLLHPRIKVFFSTRANARIKPEIVNLSYSNCMEKIVGREAPEKWNFPDINELWAV